MNVSKDNVGELGLEFKEYRKHGTTMMAGPLDPPVNVETVTGWHLVDDQPCYIAIDSDGYPYPVAEGIVSESYTPVEPDKPTDDTGHKVEVYRDEAGEYRWRRKAGNNEIIAESGEGYQDHGYALHQAHALNPGVEVGDLTEVEQTHPLP